MPAPSLFGWHEGPVQSASLKGCCKVVITGKVQLVSLWKTKGWCSGEHQSFWCLQALHLHIWKPAHLARSGLAAGSTKGQQDAHPSQRTLSFLSLPQIAPCCLALVMVLFIFSLLTFKEEAIWPHRFAVAVGMPGENPLCSSSPSEEHRKAWKSWGYPWIQRRCAGIGLDTNLIIFNLSMLVFNCLLLPDSTSAYGKSDKTSSSLKNCVTEANLCVTQLKSRMHVLTQTWEWPSLLFEIFRVEKKRDLRHCLI